MIIWPDKKLALAIHDRQLAEHGGTEGIRDESLLESALARPQQLYAYGDPAPDLAALGASLGFGLARNYPFVDGNKRTAYVMCLSFLALNGAELVATTREKYLTFLAVAEGEATEEELAQWLRHHLRLNVKGDIQESPTDYAASL